MYFQETIFDTIRNEKIAK